MQFRSLLFSPKQGRSPHPWQPPRGRRLTPPRSASCQLETARRMAASPRLQVTRSGHGSNGGLGGLDRPAWTLSSIEIKECYLSSFATSPQASSQSLW
ncbi:Os05g0182650 [Oryza sativa Japonica Group]|uniref:Os05g0182650 protein n=2 Tax=Oryza sativa subsp. japonica TaxID=39947 RepID=C7J2M2_ORYSJ|nr:hypothetical protein EE612_027525 [Oryza sativa]BAH92977.1 Os05g0182650 [Oryza sativa Japonica Group]BAS92579.1 Os05g0182650 [Oryza sativa Japonica Group]|eukprot:NP_001174249.1 Os05g0182650 [Oryza sativa Japonica Group]